MLVTEDLSPMLRNVNKQNAVKKMLIWVQKYEKNRKSKTELKSTLRAVIKELTAFSIFFQISNPTIDKKYQGKPPKN